jgi:hypothetical protein
MPQGNEEKKINRKEPSAAKPQPSRSDSRKGAKGAKGKRIFTLRSWRLGARIILRTCNQKAYTARKFAQVANTFRHSNVKSNIKARWIVSRKVAKHVLSKVEGGAKNKNFEARNLKFETISNDQNRNM